MRLIGTRVAIVVDELQTKTASGLLVPEAAAKRQFATKGGVVKFVGRGTYSVGGQFIVPDVPVGARVIFPAGSGIEIEHEGEKLLVMEQEMLIAFFDPPQEVIHDFPMKKLSAGEA